MNDRYNFFFFYSFNLTIFFVITDNDTYIYDIISSYYSQKILYSK